MLAGICDLAAPADVFSGQGVAPGTVFLVLAGNRVESRPVYAELALDDCGAISVNGNAVDDWTALVESCLEFDDALRSSAHPTIPTVP
jgi:hypothetical protein